MSLFKSILVAATILAAQVSFAADAISFQDAPKFYNQTKTVEGTVVSTYCNDKMCFLNFDKDFRKYLSAVIMASDFAKFTKAAPKDIKGEMDKMYMGKKVQITGMLNEYKGKDDKTGRPQISLTDVANIKVITK
ncbi:MAG: hypothetical protein ACXVAX_00385 [Pseudobdellovibrio sp.]